MAWADCWRWCGSGCCRRWRSPSSPIASAAAGCCWSPSPASPSRPPPLFPTSYRSTASGTRAIIATVGAAAGLATQGLLFAAAGGHAAAITSMLVLVPVAPVVVLLFLPETANRELEEVSPER